ncbi:DoxX family protein [Flavobacterium amniphilum]|uniref:DoxX family protein n=1 Tax=Flavobacterium amniphilum TaxID=1834035 RepID=UPI002029E807|nr:DoxX family protein [Flavobacterium amniphilum]MCL9806979.1 DoxX family protein [Flavobacterium amniphilum]
MNITNFLTKFKESSVSFDLSILFFRVVISLQLIVVHGLKKIGIGTEIAEKVPNPFHFPELINQSFAICSSILFPLLVIIGLYTRLATIPILIVTLSGYFIVHWNDTLLERDVPFMYSICFLLIFLTGPGKYALDSRFKRS